MSVQSRWKRFVRPGAESGVRETATLRGHTKECDIGEYDLVSIMSKRKTIIWYHLPKSFLTITGTVTTTTTAAGGQNESKSTELALATRADPAACYGVKLERSLFSDNEIDLEVSEKGLLTSSNATSTGQLGTIFKNVASFAATVAGAATGLRVFPAFAPSSTPAGTAPTGSPPSPATLYSTEHPGRAQRRQEIADAIDHLLETVIVKERSLAGQSDEKDREATRAHIADLEQAITDLREQAEPLDRHYASWKATKEQETTETHEFEIAISELPTVKAISDLGTNLPTEAGLGSSFPIYEKLGIVVARLGDVPKVVDPSAAEARPAAGSAHSGAFYRKVVPMRLHLFAKDSGKLKLIETEVHEVIDEASRPGYLEFKRNRWSSTTVEAGFGDGGSLTRLKHTKTSTVAAATTATKELPEEVLDALNRADSIVDAHQKLRLQGIDHRLQELDREKKELDAEIALGDLIDTRALANRLKVVKAEKDLLTARKELGEARVALEAHEKTKANQLEIEALRLKKELATSEKGLLESRKELEAARDALAISEATETLRTQTEILKIRQELEQARIDRAGVLHELRELLAAGDDGDGNGDED